MRMNRPDAPEVTSYAGAIASILSSLTLTDIGVIFGILTALATFILNWWVKTREELRAEREHEARMKLLERGLDV